jgi:hypothetical protein
MSFQVFQVQINVNNWFLMDVFVYFQNEVLNLLGKTGVFIPDLLLMFLKLFFNVVEE